MHGASANSRQNYERHSLLEHCIYDAIIEMQFIDTMIDILHSKLVCVGAVEFIPHRISDAASDHCRQSQPWSHSFIIMEGRLIVCDPLCVDRRSSFILCVMIIIVGVASHDSQSLDEFKRFVSSMCGERQLCRENPRGSVCSNTESAT